MLTKIRKNTTIPGLKSTYVPKDTNIAKCRAKSDHVNLKDSGYTDYIVRWNINYDNVPKSELIRRAAERDIIEIRKYFKKAKNPEDFLDAAIDGNWNGLYPIVSKAKIKAHLQTQTAIQNLTIEDLEKLLDAKKEKENVNNED